MSEVPHADHNQFTQHPDIRALVGVSAGEFPTVAEGFGESDAAAAELLEEATVLVELDEVPVGAEVHITHAGEADEPATTVLVRTTAEAWGLGWAVRTFLPDGNSMTEPVAVRGACLEMSAVTRGGGVLRHCSFRYAVMHQAQGASGRDFPASEENLDWSGLPPADTIEPSVAEGNIKIGAMVRLPDGSLVWNLPLTMAETMTGLVTDARVVMPPSPA